MMDLLVIPRQMEVIPDTNTINHNDHSTDVKRIQHLTSKIDTPAPKTNEVIETSADVWIFSFYLNFVCFR
jgi:hypothetical protein